MAKGNPNRPTLKSSKPVGYGAKGKPFYSVNAFNASKEGHAKKQTAQNKALAPTRRAISQAQEHKGPFPITPMPGHPSANPVHVHGPATVGRITGPAPRGAK